MLLFQFANKMMGIMSQKRKPNRKTNKQTNKQKNKLFHFLLFKSNLLNLYDAKSIRNGNYKMMACSVEFQCYYDQILPLNFLG